MVNKKKNIYVLIFVFIFLSLSTTKIYADEVAVKRVSFVAVGDIMFHIPEIKSAYDGKNYNFDPMFEDIKSDIENADISMGNFESVVDPDKKFSGYPKFNAPKEVINSVKHAGFDVMAAANNHIMDMGVHGLTTTTSLIKKAGITVIGAGAKNDKKYAIINKNGIRIGILAYTFGTNAGIAPKGMVNYIDLTKIKKDVSGIRKKCDAIIVYFHSGTEYVRNVEEKQRKTYRLVADMGVDCILSSHPHVARDSEIYKTKDGRNVFINYSMGNFISNQNDKYTDVGLMIKLDISKRGSVTTVTKDDIIPVYRLRYTENNKTVYRVIPCSSVSAYKNVLKDTDISYINDLNNKFKEPDAVPVFNNN